MISLDKQIILTEANKSNLFIYACNKLDNVHSASHYHKHTQNDQDQYIIS